MARRILLIVITLVSLPGVAAAVGPDVVVALIYDIRRWARVGDITAYSIATTSCNLGDQPLSWIPTTNAHPVIAQNMYRLKDGRFEQIGMSWLKHGFASTNESLCQLCSQPSGDPQYLFPGCSDPYSAGLNGQQNLLGPRSDVNASTGVFPYPFTSPPISDLNIDRRIQVRDADLIPSLNVGAMYFAEAHYVSADDAAAGNGANNASYIRILIGESPPGSFTFVPSVFGSTVLFSPGIKAWQDNDASVVMANADVPGDGRIIVAAKATALGNGFWRYEYAVENLNSDRSVGTFGIPLESHTPRQNVGFHDVNCHSGEPYSNTDWPSSYAAGEFTWATQSHGTNVNANAIRWGSLYNFRVDVNSPPIANAQIKLGLFKPGVPTNMTVTILGPSPAAVDCNNNMTPDWQEIQGNPALDCDNNGNLDVCDPDCNGNGIPDVCDITTDPTRDCNGNGKLDVCELPVGNPAPGGPFFCTSNCLPDCNHNGKPDSCDIASATDPDCNGNTIPDSCDIGSGFSVDCNANQIPDTCEIAGNPGLDCNTNGLIDSCGELDCNGNTIPDDCEGPACPGILAGDINCNGFVQPNDIPGFVNLVLIGKPSCSADINHDGKVNGVDVVLFTDVLVP